MLLEIAQRRQKKVFEWSVTTGLVPAGTSIQVRNTATPRPKTRSWRWTRSSTRWSRPFSYSRISIRSSPRGNHAVIRKLKEIAQQLKNSYKTIVLVSPILEMPAELEKEVTLVSFPLPSRDEIGDARQNHRGREAVRPVRIELDASSRERLLQAALGLTIGEAENVFAKILVTERRLSGEHVQHVFSEKQQIVRKSGLAGVLRQPRKRCTQRRRAERAEGVVAEARASPSRDEARAFGLPAPKGILLLGVQGCGKSLCAKAVVHHCGNCRSCASTWAACSAASSARPRRTSAAPSPWPSPSRPAILWVDEIDKAFARIAELRRAAMAAPARASSGRSSPGCRRRTAPVFVVATANDISQLPPELLRKGRFDEIFFVDLPSTKEREQIFRIHLVKRGRDPANFDLTALAEAADEFSGAEIEQAIISALYDAFSTRSELTTRHILLALKQSVPLAATMDEHIDRLRRWAEGRARNASPRSLQS